MSPTRYALGPSGEIYDSGDFDTVNSYPRTKLVMLHRSGAVDTTFNAGTSFSGPLSLINDYRDDSILVLTHGTIDDGNPIKSLVRLQPDGSLDKSFDYALSGMPSSLVVTPENRILVLGETLNNSKPGAYLLGKMGTVATTGHPSILFPAQANFSSHLPEEKLLVAENFEFINGRPMPNVARLNADLTVETDFSKDIGVTSEVRTGLMQSDGKMILHKTSSTRDPIIRINPDGSLDSGFSNHLPASTMVHLAIVQANDQVLISSTWFDSAAARSTVTSHRLKPNGELDPSFYAGGSGVWTHALISHHGELLTTDGCGYLHRYRSVAKPTITNQPVARRTLSGNTIEFDVTISSEALLTYLWYKDGVTLSGATEKALQFSNVRPESAGSYYVEARSAAGAVRSEQASLTVIARPESGASFGALSQQAGHVGFLFNGENRFMFIAFIADGGRTYFSKEEQILEDRRFIFQPMLLEGETDIGIIRVIGSVSEDGSLSGKVDGKSFAIPAPNAKGPSEASMGFYILGEPEGSGSGFLVVGADNKMLAIAHERGFAGSGILQIDGGAIAGTLSGGNNASGSIRPATCTASIAFAIDTGAALQMSGSDTSRRSEFEALTNLSSRSLIDASNPSFTIGFVVTGNRTKDVLVRGIGHALRQYGVANALAVPDLRLFAGTRQIAQNTAWSASTEKRAIAAATAQVSAFALPDGAADSALLLYLSPGLYTVQVS